MALISDARVVRETETGRTRVRWELGAGFHLVTQNARGEESGRISIDPASIDKLVEMWPAWIAQVRADAPAASAQPETPSRSASRAGPAPSNSRSSEPPPSSGGRLL